MNSKSLLLSLSLAAAALASSASGALVVAWDANNIAPGTTHPAAWDQDDNVNASTLDVHGSVHLFGNNSAVYTGFSTTIDNTNYLGFTVQAKDGYQINLTDLAFNYNPRFNDPVSFQWGYRIDTGSGFGAWQLSDVQSTGGSSVQLTWDFADFSTTGKVEFGFFASTDAGADITPLGATGGKNDLQLNGSVTPVPETSAALLAIVGAAGLLRRRR